MLMYMHMLISLDIYTALHIAARYHLYHKWED